MTKCRWNGSNKMLRYLCSLRCLRGVEDLLPLTRHAERESAMRRALMLLAITMVGKL